MAACRFLMGMLSRMIAISNYWWIYQTALPRQKTRIVSMPLLCYSVSNICVYIASLFDDGGVYYWRIIAGFPVFLGLILVPLDIIFVRKMNSIKYLVMTKGLAETKQIAYKMYDQQTADDLCEDFYQVSNPQQEVKSTTMLQEIKSHKNQFKHTMLVTFLVCYSYFTVYESFFVLIGSKNLNDTEQVEKAKLWAVFAVVSETVSYLINSVFDLGKNMRRLLISTYWLAIVSALLVTKGYYSEDLMWARFSSISHGLCIGGIYGSFNPYYLTVLPATLSGLPHIVLNFNNALINQLFPLWFT